MSSAALLSFSVPGFLYGFAAGCFADMEMPADLAFLHYGSIKSFHTTSTNNVTYMIDVKLLRQGCPL